MTRSFKLMAMAAMVLMVTSCASTKDFPYFQDLANEQTLAQAALKKITLKPNDKISIIVKANEPELSNQFNKALSSNIRNGVPETNQMMSGYVLDEDGYINYPVLGRLKVAGMTREEVERFIEQKLKDSDQLKNCVVTVDYMDMRYNVLGEVRAPGSYELKKNGTTIFDALGEAGDLTQYGLRKNVVVVRNEGSESKVYKLDLTSAKQIYESPAFYIQQNDLVYVSPNKTRARQSSANGNQMTSLSFWVSAASMLTTIAVLFIK